VLFDKLDAETRERDPLIAAASDLNLLRSRSPRHGEELCQWTEAFIRSLGLPESDYDTRLRRAACLLADIGWRAHPDYRGEQSLTMVAYAAFVGLDHPARAYIGLSIFFRHDGIAADKASPRLKQLAGPRLFERARLLGALMRVAYPVTVAMEGILPRAPFTVRDRQVVLQLPPALAPLANERLNGRVKAVGKLLDLEPRIEILGS
jgi:exopolyphosphatase / guanosine-5'-triphosphate,3'-diphosphate pyrophosphatase